MCSSWPIISYWEIFLKLTVLQLIINAVQPFLVPVCFVSAWLIVLLAVWNIWAAARDSIKTAKQMHQIPCPGCRYFTDDYRLNGPYIESLAINSPNSPVSSRNQQVRVFNPALKDQINWASDQIEVHIFKNGSRLVTGYRGGLELS